MAKKKRYQDPHAAREAARYDNPIPSRELIIQILNDEGRPLSNAELMRRLGVTDEESQTAFERRLAAMIRQGQLVQNRSGHYGIAERMDLIAGRVQGHKDGFGFVIPDESGQEDLFLAPRQMQAVMDGDRVLVSAEGRNRFGKREARIVQVVERSVTELVGIYRREAGVNFLLPQNRRITKEVLITDMGGLKPQNGDHVRGIITQYPGEERHVLVTLAEIIASPDEPGMEVEVALRNFEIPWIWPEEVEREAEAIPDEVEEKDKKKRVDLRDLPLVTIDGEDARDFDDAIYVERRKRGLRNLRGGGWRLIVAIADVSHYVHPDSPLDVEAKRRGTSVYFPQRVVPMLPEKLSNGLCSLNPRTDRLCLFCDMQISAAGRITGFKFGEGVMRSRHRLTYTKVGALLESPDSDLAKRTHKELDGETVGVLEAFHELYQALREQRDERGAIDFETTETMILYDEQKKIRAIEPVYRNVAHKMIEEAMLAANICAARLLSDVAAPTLYRNHEPPTAEKLAGLQQFLGPLGMSIDWSEKKGEPSPRVFKRLTAEIAGRPDREVIQTVMLRSLKQAKYEAENKGHFGLAYKAYTHFTSPIRRYPDLLVHRAIRYLVRSGEGGSQVTNPGKLPKLPRKRILPYEVSDMVLLGEHASLTERRADEASRDVVQWLKCQYMEQHLGDTFTGVISGVASFGIFVQLADLYIEGMVHVANLPSDYYHHDQIRHAMVGESSGRRYRLGDTVRVRVAAVHTEDRKIDLLVEESESSRRRGGGTRQALAEGRIPGKGNGSGQKRGGGARKGGGQKRGGGSGKGGGQKQGGGSGKDEGSGKSGGSGGRSSRGKSPAGKEGNGPPRGKKAARRRRS